MWRAALAVRAGGAAAELAAGRTPPGWVVRRAGDLGIALVCADGGVRLVSLFDVGRGQELAAADAIPLFTVTLRKAGAIEEHVLASDRGWSGVRAETTHDGFVLRWDDGHGITVAATAVLEVRTSAIRWRLAVGDHGRAWSVVRVAFPQLRMADLGDDGAVFVPQGPGRLVRGVSGAPFEYRGDYPGCSCGMQFTAAYRAEGSGLYLARHDPWGGAKTIVWKSDPATHTLDGSFETPAPAAGTAGNGFTLDGTAVWQLLRGDWFDAATTYKAWARGAARWWPIVGRPDTPAWDRSLPVWAAPRPLLSYQDWRDQLPALSRRTGYARDVVPPARRFAEFMGVPVGFHWYYWHAIPFDDDYPHYFPAKDGFRDGVRELQRSGVRVMPYVNARLWDTHAEFDAVARRAAAKRDDGTPVTETYGTKEQDGSPVEMAVMCPTTPVWQRTVRDLVLRLFREDGVDAVYLDQVGGAPPVACMDPAHGHPRGGGHWWTDGYRTMLDGIRRAMPPGRALTTECSAEPYVRWFDGYLTWDWQYDGQVPAFPAVYGGTIQTFGRAYRGGPTKDLALRMKVGQQLVFGEQLGWLDPAIVDEADDADFLRRAARLRWRWRSYFAAGDMARPPRLAGDVPSVTADWEWLGAHDVTTDAVLAGAWRRPRRLLVVLANVGDAPVTAAVRVDRRVYGTPARVRRAVAADGEAPSPPVALSLSAPVPFTLPARTLEAWELSW